MRSAGLLGVALLLLAGCSQDPGSAAVELGDGSQVQLKDADATASRGAISGVVVDEAIRPVAGALLTLLGPQASATSDENGLFTFERLEPGLYTVAANATGYFPAQTTAEVLAGDVAKVRMVLPLDTTPKPYHTTLKFDGFVQAGNGLVDQAYQLFVKDVTGIDFCTCQFYFQAEAEPETQVIEVTWEPSVQNPTAASSGYWALWDDGSSDYYDDGCDNPCLARVDGGFQPEARNFHTDIWLDSDWVQYEQSFTEYVTLFYVAPAPEGWSFIAGDP